MIRSYFKMPFTGMIIALVVFLIMFFADPIRLWIEIPKGHGKELLDINFKKKYKGIITDKYIDSCNHVYETLDIRLVDSSEYYIPPYGDQYDSFYDYVQVGDSIIRKNWGFKVYIKRDSIETSFILRSDYNE